MKLTKIFSPERFASALTAWQWLDLAGKTPRFASMFGDIFLEAVDGSWWFLDTIAGALTRIADTEAELMSLLATEPGEDRYLLGPLVEAAAARGQLPGPDEVFDLMPPPVLGGGFAAENVVIQDFVVSVDIAGQIHEQVRHLPPGTHIGGVTIA